VPFPDDVLADGERVVVHRNPHWRVLVWPVLTFLIVVGAAGYAAALVHVEGQEQWGWPAVAAVALLLIVWLTVLPLVRWRSTHLVVTTRRLLVRAGVYG
jgi:membrane protein YdbS with pleckstrin-like domain